MEPNQGNIRHWLDNLYLKYRPLEQARWNQSNIDTLFHAGCQQFVNRYFNFSGTTSFQQYYFNLVQQPCNMITGYERQHRKQMVFSPTDGADPQTNDQYTKMMSNVCGRGDIYEKRSRAKELAAISGMVLAQPYLDFNGDDHAQGEMKLKIWEYNSFIVDPYFRNPDMSDAQFVWCQEYISKEAAADRFPDKNKEIQMMSGSAQRYGNFYFLPETYNMARNDLLILSYVWYKSTRMKKRLYSRSLNQFFDFGGDDGQLEMMLYNIPDMEQVTVKSPTWKLAVVLNDQMMYQGLNPLGFDTCPFVPYFWNYDPQINYADLRVRSLVRTMRDPQFLFNYKVITNNDIAAATINAGWKRKSGAVANEDNLKRTGQGWDIIINEGYEMTDVEKLIPSAVPESDLKLAQQMADLIYNTSGINMENWSGQTDKQISALTAMIKQAANLLVFQKYFDQWDYADKILGDIMLQIQLNNWNAQKVQLMIGEEPSPFFYSKLFAKYKVDVEEADMTPTQQNLQAQQMLDINERFQREVFPPSMIIPKLNITGKGEIIPYLQQQEQQMQEAQSQDKLLAQSFQDAQLKELYSKAANNIASAKERYGRFQSNIGLEAERESEMTKNRALATKAKAEALEKLLDAANKFGELETMLKMNDLEFMERNDKATEDFEIKEANQNAMANEFSAKIMNGLQKPNTGQQDMMPV